MTTLMAKGRTIRALGWRSVWRVARYRLGLKTRLAPVLRLAGTLPVGDIFASRPLKSAPAPAPQAWRTQGLLFGYHPLAVGYAPPGFNVNPMTGERWPSAAVPWWQVSDFGADDIKLVWELSRFPWLAPMAQQARTGDPLAMNRLNGWLAAWLRDNPPYFGPNWKCGQEASLRLLILALAAHILDQVDAPTPALVQMLETHLCRIAPTIGYALGQDNNHGTSEAAALFVGGSWLQRLGIRGGSRWAQTGRRWLDERAKTLIAADGSFSQHSVVYHRLMLDTYCMAEWWRRRLALPAFADLTYARLRDATSWLHQMVDPSSGDAPNMGANDGARLIMLSDADYRDFRPSVDRAMVLFNGERAFADDDQSSVELAWLGLSATNTAVPPVATQYDDGGYVILRAGTVRALLRYPRFRFRPSQADALHLDLWIGARNVIRDAGSFSYHGVSDRSGYFSGTRAHSTIEFDARDQMPRVSRFLFGDWLETNQIEPLHPNGAGMAAGAGYRDRCGAKHFRRITLHDSRIVIEDTIAGFQQVAMLRWRLDPADWQPIEAGVTDGRVSVRVEVDGTPAKTILSLGSESLYYREEHTVPVLEFAATKPGRLITTITWMP